MQNGMELEERDFFKEPFTQQELHELATDVGTAQLFARRSPSLKKMGLADQDLSDDQMLSLMLQEPRLVRRPLVRLGGRLLVGANLMALAEALDSGE